MCLSAAKRLNAGDRNSGILAWIALMAAVLVPVGAGRRWLAAGGASVFVVWVLDVALLYGTLRFLATARPARRPIEAALRERRRGRRGQPARAMAGRAGRDRAMRA